MRPTHPEDPWRGASLDQIADLRTWGAQRLPEAVADALARWVLSVNAGDRPHVSRRRLGAFRHLLDRYGPPRPITIRLD